MKRPRCADCVHFEAPEHIYEWETRYDEEHPERRPRAAWGSCRMSENTFDDGSYAKDTLAIAVDGSSYTAGLMVDPEFGCVQFEAKP